jgi:hypothetical protein
MNTLQMSFISDDSTGRGSVFVLKNGFYKEVYLRVRVANPSLVNAGTARVFLTRLERVEPSGEKTVITQDTLALNWSRASVPDVIFYPGYEHFADLLTFTMGSRLWLPITLRTTDYWRKELVKPGIYRMHLLLTGPAIQPVEAIFEMNWPIKKLSPECFSFSIANPKPESV